MPCMSLLGGVQPGRGGLLRPCLTKAWAFGVPPIHDPVLGELEAEASDRLWFGP